MARDTGLLDVKSDDRPGKRLRDAAHGAVPGHECTYFSSRPVIDMSGCVSERTHITTCEEVRDSPQRLTRNAHEERAPGDACHLGECVPRSLEMLQDLERAHAVERACLEWQLVCGCRRERKGPSRALAPVRTQGIIAEVDPHGRHARQVRKALRDDPLATSHVEDRARLQLRDRVVDLVQEAIEQSTCERIARGVLLGCVSDRADEVRAVRPLLGRQRRTSSTSCSMRSRSPIRSSCCEVISSDSNPSETNWMPTTMSSTPSVSSGR